LVSADSDFKFLIAGLGSIGRRHLRNLVASGQRDIILFRTHRSTLPDDELASFQTEMDLQAALAQKPDAVIISNPTALHLDVAIPAAEAGCHLLMEKPVSDQFGEPVQQLLKLTQDKALKTLVGFQFRHHPVLLAIKRLLEDGTLGRPLSARVHWGEYLPGWHPWEDYGQSYAARKDLGGGVVNTLCHPLDYLCWLLGEVVSVSAFTGQLSDLEMDVEDAAEITLAFDSGCVGSVHLDYYQRPPSHWFEVTCSNGLIHWDNASAEARVFRVEEDLWETLAPPDGFERNDLFLEEMRHFLALLKGEATSQCSLSEGVRVLRLTEAVHDSAAKGCRLAFGR
jgi:predicted dehydrogenase